MIVTYVSAILTRWLVLLKWWVLIKRSVSHIQSSLNGSSIPRLACRCIDINPEVQLGNADDHAAVLRWLRSSGRKHGILQNSNKEDQADGNLALA